MACDGKDATYEDALLVPEALPPDLPPPDILRSGFGGLVWKKKV